MLENPYEVLGITTTASPSEVKRAYRRKVLCCHPDAAGEGHEEEFRRVQEAYESLGGDSRIPAARPSSRQAPTPPPSWAAPRMVSSPLLRFELELDPREAATGVRLSFPVTMDVPCPHCARSGLFSLLCTACGGWGCVGARVLVNVAVPAGVSDGEVLRIPGFARHVGPVAVEFLVHVVSM